MRLTNEEYNVLSRILYKTKMDCWFDIRTDKNHNDYCYDLEEHKKISLKTALSQAMEGFVDLPSLGITSDEIDTLNEILFQFGLISEEAVEEYLNVYAGNGNGICC